MSVDQCIPDWAKAASPTEDEVPPTPVSWREALGAALFAGLVVGTAVFLANQPVPPNPVAPPDEGEDVADELAAAQEELEAAARLGVDVDASDDVVRAALRDRITASRVHPDQGGDHDEAARLISAKNLLCARARRRERDTE